MKQGQGTPSYGKYTEQQEIKTYFKSPVSMDELSKNHGVLGSNTNDNGLKKNKNLGIPKFPKLEKMNKSHSPT